MNRMRFFSILLAALFAVLQIESTYGQLSLTVNRTTGGVQLVNSPQFSAGPISFDAYQITSASGALNPATWFSLQDQGLSDWFKIANSSSNLIGEFKLVGGQELGLGQSLNIGNPFFGFDDLEFEFAATGGTIQSGPVLYVGDPFPPAGLLGDYNNDGVISHADYSVMGDLWGQDAPLANRDPSLFGPIGVADFQVYRANYGQVVALGSVGSSPISIGQPITVVPTATPEGNTEWVVAVEGVPNSLAGHLNIASSQSNFLSASGGSSMLDDGTPPAGVPGRTLSGVIEEGVFFENRQAFAALGSTLGAASPGQDRAFVKLVTEGDDFTTLSIQGELGYGGVTYFVNSSFSFGPGSSSSEPLLPNATVPGQFIFQNVPSGVWVDPPLVDRFEYVMDSASLFTAILDFPPGFAAEFAVTAENTLLGEFGPGDSVDFVALLGHGVGSFVVSNITPLADAADPNAFPLKLSYSTPTASFRMLAVPEPGTLVLVMFASVTISIRRQRIDRGWHGYHGCN